MTFSVNVDDFKEREECNGTFSYWNYATQKVVFMNKLASFIIHSGTDNIEDLVNEVYNRYEGVTKEEIRRDCIKVLYQMEAVGLIKIDEDFAVGTNTNSICVAGESDFRRISSFVTRSLKSNKHVIMCGYNRINDYSVYQVRARQFNNNEYNVIYFGKSGEIEALLTFGKVMSENVYTLVNIFAPYDRAEQLKSMIKYMALITKKLTKIRVTIKDDSTSIRLISLLNELGFKKEAVLCREYDNTNVICFALFREDILGNYA